MWQEMKSASEVEHYDREEEMVEKKFKGALLKTAAPPNNSLPASQQSCVILG